MAPSMQQNMKSQTKVLAHTGSPTKSAKLKPEPPPVSNVEAVTRLLRLPNTDGMSKKSQTGLTQQAPNVSTVVRPVTELQKQPAKIYPTFGRDMSSKFHATIRPRARAVQLKGFFPSLSFLVDDCIATMPIATKTHSTGAKATINQPFQVRARLAQPVADVVTFEQLCVEGTPDTPGTRGSSDVFAAFGMATENVVLAAIGTAPGNVELPAIAMAPEGVVLATIEIAALFNGTGFGPYVKKEVEIGVVAWPGPGCA